MNNYRYRHYLLICLYTVALSISTPAPIWADDEDLIEEHIEDELESDTETDLEKELEDEIEAQLEEELEEGLEEEIEDELEEELEDELEEELEDELEEELEDELEEELEDELEDELEEELEDELSEELEDKLENELERTIEVDNRLVDRQLELLEKKMERRQQKFVEREWLIMSSQSHMAALQQQGYLVTEERKLDNLQLTIARITSPNGISRQELQKLTEQFKGLVEIDRNHFYRGSSQSPLNNHYYQPEELLKLNTSSPPKIIGMIDSNIDADHPAFHQCQLSNKNLTHTSPPPQNHGTAVASILCGQSSELKGLLSNATVFNAGVFFQHPKLGETTDTLLLIQAVDWLLEKKVNIINMSLAGPDNLLLKTALLQAHNLGITTVAAAGNNGPSSPPLFPAGYPFTIAVTATVPHKNYAYRLAGRGPHIDLAAPGVNIYHAKARTQEPGAAIYEYTSGTSLASAFVTAALASGISLQQLYNTSIDLGTPGRDNLYGQGLIQNPSQ